MVYCIVSFERIFSRRINCFDGGSMKLKPQFDKVVIVVEGKPVLLVAVELKAEHRKPRITGSVS